MKQVCKASKDGYINVLVGLNAKHLFLEAIV